MVCEPILITGPHLVTCVARCRRATGALIGSGGSALGCGCGLRWALSLTHQTAFQTSAAPCAGGRAGGRDAGLAAASRSCMTSQMAPRARSGCPMAFPSASEVPTTSPSHGSTSGGHVKSYGAKNTHQSRTGIRLELLIDRHYRPSWRTRHHLTMWGGVNFSPLALHLILRPRARGKRARKCGGGWVGGLKVGVTPHPLYVLLTVNYCVSALCIVYSPELLNLITPLSRSFSGTRLIFLVCVRVADQCDQASPYAVSLRTTSFRQRRSAISRRIALFSTLAFTVAAYKHRHAMNSIPDSWGPTHLSSAIRPTARYAVTSAGTWYPMSLITFSIGFQNSLRMTGHSQRWSWFS